MSDFNKVQLKVSSILNVPIQTYNEDFTFIVNGQEYKTSRLISDLLSTKISRIHLIDPTFNRFTINTENQGDFSTFLQLMNFQEQEISTKTSEFLYEIIEKLGCENYEIIEPLGNTDYLTIDNIFSYLHKDEQKKQLFQSKYLNDIEFFSKHFTEITSKHPGEINNLKIETLLDIISNSKLQLQDEDDLVRIINELYKLERKYSKMYEYVIFENVSKKIMIEFLDVFDYSDIDHEIWSNLSNRLQLETSKEEKKNNEKHKNRYKEEKIKENIKEVLYNDNKEMNGIIKYLTDKTGGNIHDNGTIEVTSSSISSDHPKNLLDFNKNNYYKSRCNNDMYAWICFDFKNYEIEISNYSIKSFEHNSCHNPKNWVIEISNDGENWTTIDEQKDYAELKGTNIVKTFKVKANKFSRYCRFRHTGEYWGCSGSTLRINSIEFYGHLKEPKSSI